MIFKHREVSILLCLMFIISLSSSSLIELTNTTFSSYISSNERTFLYFYSPSCKYCHLLEPEIKKLPDLVEKLGIEGSSITFARVDGNEYVELAEKYGVDRFPTLFLFDEGFVVPYDQARNATEISKWLKQYFSNRIIEVSTEEMDNKQRPFIALHNPSEEAVKVFNQALFGFIGINAYRTLNNEEQSISIYSRDMTQIEYKGELERIEVKKWIQNNVKLAIIPIVDKVVESTLQNDKNIPVLVFVLSEEDRLKQEKYEIFVRFCESTQEKLICGQILPSYDTFKGSHGYFQVSDTNKSFVGLVQEKMNIAYRMDTPFEHINEQNLAKFVDGCLKGEIKRIVDNVPPEHIVFEDVIELNSENFDENILKNDHTFVNFYRGNESVSKLFSRPYESFAKIVSEEKELKGTIISAFDCSKDEELCAKYKFDFYPSLIFFIHGIPVEYEKTKKLPEIPHLMEFVASKKSAKLVRLESINELKSVAKPAFVIYAKETQPLFEALPAIVSSVDSYLIQTDTDETKLELILTDEMSQTFKGDLNSFSIKNWVRKETRQLLSNMMQDNLDKALMNAVSNKEKILFILDMDKQTSDKNRLALASIAKSLDICGAYADGEHLGFPSLLQWIGIDTPEKSTLIIVDIEKDRRYAYPGEIEAMTSESVKKFIDDIKNGKIKKIEAKVPKVEQGEREIKEEDENKEEVITEEL